MNTQIPQHTTVERVETCTHSKRTVSWSAIIIGALFGIGISFLLNLFALGIGLSAFTSTTPQTLAVGGIIGLIIISIFSMGILGWIAGFIGATKSLCYHDKTQCNFGCIYGFSAWCLALVLSMLLAMPAAQLVAHSIHALNPTLNTERLYTQSNVLPSRNDTSTTTSSTTRTNEVARNNVVTDEDTHKILVRSIFTTFVMFFIGAISASIGGHLGYKRYSRTEDIHK
jgi:hypothetical protein